MEALDDFTLPSQVKIAWFIASEKISPWRGLFQQDPLLKHSIFNIHDPLDSSVFSNFEIIVGDCDFYDQLHETLNPQNELYFLILSESEQLNTQKINSLTIKLSRFLIPLNLCLEKEINENRFQIFLKAVEKNKRILKEKNLTNHVKVQNKKLEVLSENLEQIVNERTHEISLSSKEESEKLQSNQKLIYFIKALAETQNTEEVFDLLRREIKNFHFINDVVILINEFNVSYKVFYYSKSHIKNKYFSKKFDPADSFKIIESLEIKSKNIKLFSFASANKSASNQLLQNREFNLLLNHSMNDSELKIFSKYFEERVSALEVALERIYLQEELETYVLRWNKTFNGIKDPIAVVDSQFGVLKRNSYFKLQFITDSCHKNFANSHKPCEGCPIEKVFSSGRSHVSNVTNNGQVFEVHSYPLFDHRTGKVERVFNQYINNTEEKHMYLKIIQNEKIGAIGQLAGHIAHELNNPLSGLKSLSQIVLSETNPQSQIHLDLLEVEKAALRSQKIIKNLIEFSQPGKGELLEEKLDEIIERTLPLLKSSLRPYRQNLSLNASHALVKLEPQLLQQVIFNLVNNACYALKGVEKGEVKIATYLEKDFAVINIADNGPGINQENLDKIFSPFYTTKKEGEGTGLGLSLSKSIIERFGGQLSVVSQPSCGASFFIKLPLIDPSAT